MNEIKDIILSSKEKESIRVFLEQQEGVPISVHEGIRELWYQSEDRSSELRLLFLQNMKITISRVEFINRRKGTMTKVLSILESFCKKKKVSQIVVQSVETPEMAKWCVKMGFTPNPNSTFPFNDVMLGDYIKQIL